MRTQIFTDTAQRDSGYVAGVMLYGRLLCRAMETCCSNALEISRVALPCILLCSPCGKCMPMGCVFQEMPEDFAEPRMHSEQTKGDV